MTSNAYRSIYLSTHEVGSVASGPGLDLPEGVDERDVGREVGLAPVGSLGHEEGLAAGRVRQPLQGQAYVVLHEGLDRICITIK